MAGDDVFFAQEKTSARFLIVGTGVLDCPIVVLRKSKR